MDAIGRLNKLNNKGVAVILLTLMIVVLVAFVSLAVDIGYMYIAKGQLQNAADAGALAGASKLGNLTNFTSSRNTAERFAAKNYATQMPVQISSDGSNSMSPSNDITVGHWNVTTRKYVEGTGAGTNAVKVRARRTGSSDVVGQSLGGQVNLFFSNVIGFPSMGTQADAIAACIPHAGAYFMIGKDTCDPLKSPMPLTLQIDPGLTGNMAWTTILNNSTNAKDVSSLICGKTIPDIDVCGHSLYTTQGTSSTVFQDIESAFYNPDYDTGSKLCTTDSDPIPKPCATISDTGKKYVSTWTVIVPVSTSANPGIPPNPAPVYGYAKITITRACGPGNSSGCLGKSPGDVCSGSETDIIINNIECVSCDDPSNMLGAKPNLVH